MKIYQIHDIGGKYEDACDYIVSSYLHKKAAEAALKELIEAQQKRKTDYELCMNCPINNYPFYKRISQKQIDSINAKCKAYCPKGDIEVEKKPFDYYCYMCKNRALYYEDEGRYEIVEVDVIEEEDNNGLS